MDENQTDELKAMVMQWQAAGSVLDKVRRREIRNTDTASAIRAFHGLQQWIIKRDGIRKTSGMIEFYKKMNRG